ncbi:GRIP domain [Trypanosoma vivax]|uniref:GRIP domain-containing protein n=1 Tax=Trypanosoma vivax (strain Y486) TaxID=1055687 RepID=G0TTT9_TRYVY|nr:hypothetical protein TRVL_00059 [Trypanosoma vivax]KAH8613607.1 GRIP domain [Trypanosoma vivax]CCC47371.1 conserved hypothetical protein [Trypanosoma vivax Y486]
MEAEGTDAPETLEGDHDEVKRLREELSKSKQRLKEWREKTQAGVTELRNRVVELSTLLEESHAKNVMLEERIRDMEGVAGSSSPFALEKLIAPEGWMAEFTNTSHSTFLMKSDVILGVATTVWQDLEKHKRRTAQALRLQKKNVEAMEQEVCELRQMLTRAQDEVHERTRAVESRDEALTVLQNRLEELESASVSSELSRMGMYGKPNAEQLNAFEDQLEEAREGVRREFALRESAIFDQHRDEMERLIARYEREVAELRAELDERAFAAADSCGARPTASVGDRGELGEGSDKAYKELMNNLRTLQEELRLAQDEREKLQCEVRALKKNSVMSLSCGANTGMPERPRPQTLPEALSRITELEGSVTRLSSELCEARKRLITTKQKSGAVRGQPNVLVVEGQQLAYLKFVVVKLLCSNGDTNVAMNLFPVLNTLLHFDKENLDEIYTTNPGWLRRKY